MLAAQRRGRMSWWWWGSLLAEEDLNMSVQAAAVCVSVPHWPALSLHINNKHESEVTRTLNGTWSLLGVCLIRSRVLRDKFFTHIHTHNTKLDSSSHTTIHTLARWWHSHLHLRVLIGNNNTPKDKQKAMTTVFNKKRKDATHFKVAKC